MKALLLVHLSSLDNYAEFSYDATGSYKQAFELAQRIASAVRRFRGPVYIVDQNWSLLREPSSAPRRWLLEELQRDNRIKDNQTWIQFDEQDSDWDEFLPQLAHKLAKDGVTEVAMGGVWHDPTLESGCVTTTYLYLKDFMKAKVDPRLVGCETDYGKRGDPNFIYRK